MARGFSTRVEVEGLEKGLAALRRVRDLGGNLRPFMEDAGSILVASVLRRFQTGKGPGGIPWVATKRQRRDAVGARGPNKARILVDTSDLQDSIRYRASDSDVEVGSDGLKNPVKALANQFGSKRQTVVVRHTRRQTTAFGAPLAQPVEVTVRGHGRVTNLPARPFIGIDDEDRDDLLDAWKLRLVDTFRKVNG